MLLARLRHRIPDRPRGAPAPLSIRSAGKPVGHDQNPTQPPRRPAQAVNSRGDNEV